MSGKSANGARSCRHRSPCACMHHMHTFWLHEVYFFFGYVYPIFSARKLLARIQACMASNACVRVLLLFKFGGQECSMWLYVPAKIDAAMQYIAQICGSKHLRPSIVCESAPCMSDSGKFCMMYVPSTEGYNSMASLFLTEIEASPTSCFSHLLVCRCSSDGATLLDLDRTRDTLRDCRDAWLAYKSMPDTWNTLLEGYVP